MLKKLLLLSCLCLSHFSFADNTSTNFWSEAKNTLSNTWNSGNYELYVPVNTWHNRAAYDKNKIDSYNERPWGIGLGSYHIDQDGDWHSLYIMEFQDSHNVIEPIGGYAYQTYWYPNKNSQFKIGLGYTLSITARKDYNWVPFPAPLPLLSFEYNRFSVQSTYIPGVKKNTGNILFTWLRWKL